MPAVPSPFLDVLLLCLVVRLGCVCAVFGRAVVLSLCSIGVFENPKVKVDLDASYKARYIRTTLSLKSTVMFKV